MLAKQYARERTWAVVGASNDPGKFGNRIYRTLRSAGYTVYPVNHREDRIEGDPAYASLLDLPESPVVVDLVVPPSQAGEVVREAKRAGARCVWFQPGAEEAAAIVWAKENGLDVVEDCILVHYVQMNQPDPSASIPGID